MSVEAADREGREPACEAAVRPHEACEFTNSVEYTVRLTFMVAGGACWRTGHVRACKIAERLANAAARAKGVVDVRAVAGAARDGELLTRERVCFVATNSELLGATWPYSPSRSTPTGQAGSDPKGRITNRLAADRRPDSPTNQPLTARRTPCC